MKQTYVLLREVKARLTGNMLTCKTQTNQTIKIRIDDQLDYVAEMPPFIEKQDLDDALVVFAGDQNFELHPHYIDFMREITGRRPFAYFPQVAATDKKLNPSLCKCKRYSSDFHLCTIDFGDSSSDFQLLFSQFYAKILQQRQVPFEKIVMFFDDSYDAIQFVRQFQQFMEPGDDKSVAAISPYQDSLSKTFKPVLSSRLEPPFPVFFHVYELGPHFMSVMGLGMFHTAVVLFDYEVAYGGHASTDSGIYAIQPEGLKNAKFVHKGLVGFSDLPAHILVQKVMDASFQWRGIDYDLIQHNCNDFTDYMLKSLAVGGLPVRFNRAAAIARKFYHKKTNQDNVGALGDVVKFQDPGAGDEEAKGAGRRGVCD